ncbi:MAG: tRNA (adenosine(37)-N6)-threonylcarbamoyltransferase complex transferase subunit TsaD [Chthoniobacterales bacterium]
MGEILSGDSKPIGLAIETSCDETAVAVLRGHDDLLASEVWSQASIHSEYGGVVPEVASRNHGDALPKLVLTALRRAGIELSAIDHFSATTGPGLPAALLVGVALAKSLAIARARPFLAINHLEGHLLSPFFGDATITPHVALVVSGGHTLLVDVKGYGESSILGTTVDDAAGEAFDKVAKLLGLGYPGGVEIDRLASEGDAARYDFPRSMLHSGDFQFSFSGLKTAVRYCFDRERAALPDACASFQEAVVDVLIGKAERALEQTGRTCLALSGGVSSNRRLRERAEDLTQRRGINLRLAAPALRTDNAAMIAFVASHQYPTRGGSPLDTDITPTFRGF